MNSRYTYVILVLVALLLLSLSAQACTVNTNNFDLKVRSDSTSYSDNINAIDDEYIDAQVQLTIGSVQNSIYNCGSTATVEIDIYQHTGTNYTYWISATPKTVNLTAGQTATLTWDNIFRANNSYERYQVRARITDGNNVFSTQNSTIYVEPGNCSDIVLTAYNLEIDEGTTQTKTFKITNNSNAEFDITSMYVDIDHSYLQVNSTSYNDPVQPNSYTNVVLEFEAERVSADTGFTGTFRVAGNLGSTYCAVGDISSKTFRVDIEDTGLSGTGTTSSADCSKIKINANDISMSENETKTVSFYITNESTKRFEILDVKTSNNGVSINKKFFEQYAFSGEVADIVLDVTSPGVTTNRIYENYLQVRGVFSDGRECSFTNIKEKTFNVTVNDVAGFISTDCSKLVVSVPSQVSIENYGTVDFTITNGTGKRADIIFESQLDINPTLVSLPENTSVSRSLNVSIAGNEGYILVKPRVEGCTYPTQRIEIENTARGTLSSVTMNVKTEELDNGKKLIIEFFNPTNKSFQGQLSFDFPSGWNAESRIITLAPGKNFVEVLVSIEDGAQQGEGTIRFASGGEEVTSKINPQNQAFTAGFFALGEGFAIGLILLIALVLIILLIMQADKYKTVDEEELKKWEANQ